MTRRPSIQGVVAASIPPPNPFRAGSQRLYAIYGRNPTKLISPSQRLYAVHDFSARVAYRYWRFWSFDGSEIQYTIANLELRDTLGGGATQTGGTARGYLDFNDTEAATMQDGSGTTSASTGIVSGRQLMSFGYDYGAGNEIEIVQFAVTSDDNNSRRPPQEITLQASVDGFVWETKFEDFTGAPWGLSETRVYTL